jgi:hypothetical protein
VHSISAHVQVESDVILKLGISQYGVLVFNAFLNEGEGKVTEVLEDLPEEFAFLALLLFLLLLGASEVDVHETLERFLAAAVIFIIIRYKCFRVKIEAIIF